MCIWFPILFEMILIELIGECCIFSRPRSLSITRRLCRRKGAEDNELYRSNSFKFERFERHDTATTTANRRSDPGDEQVTIWGGGGQWIVWFTRYRLWWWWSTRVQSLRGWVCWFSVKYCINRTTPDRIMAGLGSILQRKLMFIYELSPVGQLLTRVYGFYRGDLCSRAIE